MIIKIVKKLVAIVIVAISFNALTYANENIRNVYKKAEKLVWYSSSQQYQNLYKQLYYYPLKPYLDQKELISSLSLKLEPEIATFLTRYEGSPLDWPLRKKWLQFLAKNKNQRLYLKYFKPTSDVTLTCKYYLYQLAAGADKKMVYEQTSALWLKGKSQPKVCDPLFKGWKGAGYQTNEIVWQRVLLAADGGDHTLIPYLTSLLEDDQKYLATLWHRVRKNPAYVVNLKKFPGESEKEQDIIAYGLKRLIWRNQEQALSVYALADKKKPFNREQKAQIAYKFALALASKKHPQADYWLKKVPEKYVDKQIIQWRISNVLITRDWKEVQQELASFPQAKKQALQWRYWYARSLIEVGEHERGTQELKQIAEQRHYYGFLAAAHFKQAANFQDKPIEITEEEKIAVMKPLAAKRALELFHLGQFQQARREWNFWLSTLSSRQRLVASKIANEAKWYDRAIFSLSQEGYLNDVDLRFPLAFEPQITLWAKKHKINPAWAFAIARRESSFMSDAHSPVGAKGLMQIMPRTAKQLRKKKVSTAYLYNADNNISLGSLYLKQLSDRYDNNQVLATASYNAGPYRVSTWVKNKPSTSAEIWIETIPYKETREYVKSVLAYQQIYQNKLGQQHALFELLLSTQIN